MNSEHQLNKLFLGHFLNSITYISSRSFFKGTNKIKLYCEAILQHSALLDEKCTSTINTTYEHELT